MKKLLLFVCLFVCLFICSCVADRSMHVNQRSNDDLTRERLCVARCTKLLPKSKGIFSFTDLSCYCRISDTCMVQLPSGPGVMATQITQVGICK